MSLDFYLTTPEVDLGADEPFVGRVFERNITHNVSSMWTKAGCHDELYDSEGKLAQDIIPALVKARDDMEQNPKEYKKLDPPNGWGDFEGAFRFLEAVLKACRKYPKAVIRISA